MGEGAGAVGAACLFCVSGRKWCDKFKGIPTRMGLADQMLEKHEGEIYRFGSRGALPSKLLAPAPLVLCGQAGRVVFSV
eukprot:5979322-Pyramimonas_sp.AAC.1